MGGLHIDQDVLRRANRVAREELRELRALIASIHETTVEDLLQHRCVHTYNALRLCRIHLVQSGEGLFRDKLAQTMQNKIITALRSRAKTLSEHKPPTDGTTLLNIVNAHLLYFCTNVLCQIGHNKPAHARETEIRSKCRTAFAKLQPPDIDAQKPTHDKGNTQKPSRTVGYLYLIRTRACINARQSVYKIGKTRQSIHKRLNGYDKGAVIHCVFPVFGDVLDKLETTLIQAFDKRFTKRTDYGDEYFEGELMEMTGALTRVVCAKR